jgi:hypothetical protein
MSPESQQRPRSVPEAVWSDNWRRTFGVRVPPAAPPPAEAAVVLSGEQIAPERAPC